MYVTDHWNVITTLASGAMLAVMTTASPVPWDSRTRSAVTDTPTVTPVTVTAWPGYARIPGAFLLSRVNLEFINVSCSRFAIDVEVATQVATVLADTQSNGSTPDQAKRYSYMLLKLETEFQQVLEYLTDFLLCSGRGNELWSKFVAFRNQSTIVWKLLKNKGVRIRTNNNPNGEHLIASFDGLISKNTSQAIRQPPLNASLINYLEQARPFVSRRRQPRNPLLIGLGLGFLGSYLFSQLVAANNDKDIEILNRNILKQNKLIKITNERIDILAKNVSTSFDAVKTVLDKLVEAQVMRDIHYAILWNLDQLAASIADIKTTFRASEITVTLLEKGILSHDLVDIASLTRIVAEGRKFFPELEFPLEISRYHIDQIVHILEIQRIAHLKFLMVIPLTH